MPYGPERNGRPPGRGRPDDPLLREVRWRLFRREDLPARLRRLERLERAAFGDPPPPPEPPEHAEEAPSEHHADG
jgi:hypothetical protein